MLVDGDAIVIGGDGRCDIVLTDATAAPRHVLLIVLGERVIIEDLETTQGTWRDGRRIARDDFSLDDTIRIGETVLELELADIVPAPRREPWPEELSETELGLLAKLRADPADEAARQVYADWLEAEGHHLRAAFVRRAPDDASTPRDSELFGQIAAHTPSDWRAIVGRFSLRCHHPACCQRWHLLEPVDDHTMLRRCTTCRRYIRYEDDWLDPKPL